MKKLILIVCAFGSVVFSLAYDGGNYFTYENLTVWVQKEGELGNFDTTKIDNIVAMVVRGKTIELRTASPSKSIISVTEPKERIIKEVGE